MSQISSRAVDQTIRSQDGGTASPRMILIDDNIRDQGGHYFELAYLLLSGAEQLGYRCVLATHRDFDFTQIPGKPWQVHRIFRPRRLVRWSLGVDGRSRCQRDLNGHPVGGSPLENVASRVTDWLRPAAQRPTRILQQWSDDLCELLTDIQPHASDSLLVNTGDDFALLALAHAMQRIDIPPMRIDVLFHFALYESGQPDRVVKLRQLGRQMRAALESLRPHQVHLHATTDSLASQLREVESGCSIRSIPYPTRPCSLARSVSMTGSGSRAGDHSAAGNPEHQPLTAVIAGMPRAEKGKDAIAELLKEIDESLLKTGRYRMSLQLPAERWQSMVPTTLHRSCEVAMPGQSQRPLEIITQNLSTADYHQWLGTADLGLFLYEPHRYEARCSGVLLEMLARGVPVIVPDQCWLASQVRLAGGHRSIGFIYQDRAEIPDLMRQFIRRREEILPRSKAYAATIAARHEGRNSLVSMGIEPVRQRQDAA